MTMTQKSELRALVEDLLTRNPSGLRVPQIAERLSADPEDIRRVINHLRGKDLIRATEPNRSNTAYKLHKLEETVKPPAINKLSGPPYTCPELGRNPGIADSRFEAFTLPSRVGSTLYYRDGRTEAV